MMILLKTNKLCTGLKSQQPDSENPVSFRQINYLFLAALSNHTSVVYKNKMYLYGGSLGLSCNPTFFALDLVKFIWEVVRTKPHNNVEENSP